MIVHKELQFTVAWELSFIRNVQLETGKGSKNAEGSE